MSSPNIINKYRRFDLAKMIKSFLICLLFSFAFSLASTDVSPFPKNFIQAIENIKHRMNAPPSISYSAFDSTNTNFESQIADALTDTIEKNSLKISVKCEEQFKVLIDGLKSKEMWALSGSF